MCDTAMRFNLHTYLSAFSTVAKGSRVTNVTLNVVCYCVVFSNFIKLQNFAINHQNRKKIFLRENFLVVVKTIKLAIYFYFSDFLFLLALPQYLFIFL